MQRGGSGGVGQEIADGVLHKWAVHRHLFAGGADTDVPGRIAQFGAGFPDAAAVDLKFSDEQHLLANGHFADKSDIQFRCQTKPFHPARRRPEHRFIKRGGQNAAMDEVAEAGVMRGRYEIGVDFIADLPEAQAKAMRVVRATDKTIFRIR